MFHVYRIASKDTRRLDEVLKDDIVSRQSISQRDAKALGASGAGLLVLIEGHEGALRRADDLLLGVGERLPETEARHVYDLFKKESDDAASGVGFVFGP